jgi:hypothetical protein
MILDEDDRIVHVGPDAQIFLGEHEGRSLWDAFPAARPLFQPYYDQARRLGEPVVFVQFYAGYVTRVTAVPAGAELHVFWEELDHIDTLTLEGLHDSLARALGVIEVEESRLRRERARGRLRLVEQELI